MSFLEKKNGCLIVIISAAFGLSAGVAAHPVPSEVSKSKIDCGKAKNKKNADCYYPELGKYVAEIIYNAASNEYQAKPKKFSRPAIDSPEHHGPYSPSLVTIQFEVSASGSIGLLETNVECGLKAVSIRVQQSISEDDDWFYEDAAKAVLSDKRRLRSNGPIAEGCRPPN